MPYSHGPDNEPHFDHIEAETVMAETIRAKSFDLVDDNDNIRLSLYTADDGTPAVTMLDETAQERLTISLDEKQRPFIVFLGEDGHRQFDLIISPQGTPHLRLFDTAQQLRAALYVDDDRPSLNFYDNQETLRMAAYLAEDGNPYVILMNSKEQVQTKVSLPSNEEEEIGEEEIGEEEIEE